MAKTAAGMGSSSTPTRAAPQATISTPSAKLSGAGNLATKSDDSNLSISTGAKPSDIDSFFDSASPVSASKKAEVAGYNTSFNAENSVQALRDTMKSQLGFEKDAYTDKSNLMNHLSGEVGPTGIGSGQVAQTMVNRAQADNYGEFDAKFKDSLYDKNQWASIDTPNYKSASDPRKAGRVADQAIREMMDGVPAPDATDFRAVNQAGGVKTKKTGIDVAGNRFGNFEGVTGGHMAGMKAGLGAGASAFRDVSPSSMSAAANPSYDVAGPSFDVAETTPSLGAPGKGNLGAPASPPKATMNTLFSPAAAAEPTPPTVEQRLSLGIPADPNRGLDQRSTMQGVPSPTGTTTEALKRETDSLIKGGMGVNSLTSGIDTLDAPPSFNGGRKSFSGSPPPSKTPPAGGRTSFAGAPRAAENYDPLDSLAPDKPDDGKVLSVENLDPMGGRRGFSGAPPKAGNIPTPTGISPDARTAGAAFDAEPDIKPAETYDVEAPVMNKDGTPKMSEPVKQEVANIKSALAKGEISLDEAKARLSKATDGQWSAGLTKKSVPEGYVAEKLSMGLMSGYVGVDKDVYNTQTPVTTQTTTAKPRDNPFRQTAKADPTPKDPNMGLGVASLDSTAPAGMKKDQSRISPSGTMTQGDYSITSPDGTNIMKNDGHWPTTEALDQRQAALDTDPEGEVSGNPMQDGDVSPEDQKKIDDRHARNGAPSPSTTKAKIGARVADVISPIPGTRQFVEGKIADYDAMTSYEQKAFKERAAADTAKREANLKGLSSPDQSERVYTRMKLHDEWSQGINIPSPDDPLYTEYELWMAQYRDSEDA